MLKNLDLELEKNNLSKYIKETKSKVNEERAIKRLKLIGLSRDWSKTRMDDYDCGTSNTSRIKTSCST